MTRTRTDRKHCLLHERTSVLGQLSKDQDKVGVGSGALVDGNLNHLIMRIGLVLPKGLCLAL
jgi:hypothetical protein